MNFQELNGKSIREAFKEFHKNNPHVYAEFSKHCFNAIRRGRKKLSAKMIINVIRWNTFLETDDKNFRINDAFHAHYARLFIKHHREHEGIFEFRKLREKEPPPYMQVDKNGQIAFL